MKNWKTSGALRSASEPRNRNATTRDHQGSGRNARASVTAAVSHRAASRRELAVPPPAIFEFQFDREPEEPAREGTIQVPGDRAQGGSWLRRFARKFRVRVHVHAVGNRVARSLECNPSVVPDAAYSRRRFCLHTLFDRADPASVTSRARRMGTT